MLFHGLKETLPTFEFDPNTIKTTGPVIKGKTDNDIKGSGKECNKPHAYIRNNLTYL